MARNRQLGQVRRPGGGRKTLVERTLRLMEALLALVEPTTRGDPESPLRWTCKSVRRLAAELRAQGHPISRTVVGELLHELDYSLQGNRKTREGDSHPDRDAQIRYINEPVKTALTEQQPVISVDTKKKELVGDFKNGGREWRPKGEPEEVRVHDFLIKELGRAVPYGVYDSGRQRRLGQRRDRPRHRRLRGADHPPLVAGGRPHALSRGQAAADHRRWRRQQRLARAAVEARVAEAGQRDSASTSPSATCRRAPASGTRSSTASSPSSARTGAPSRWSAIASSST